MLWSQHRATLDCVVSHAIWRGTIWNASPPGGVCLRHHTYVWHGGMVRGFWRPMDLAWFHFRYERIKFLLTALSDETIGKEGNSGEKDWKIAINLHSSGIGDVKGGR